MEAQLTLLLMTLGTPVGTKHPNLAKGRACPQLCAQRSGSAFWFEPADLGHHYFSALPPSLLVLPSHWGLPDLAIGPLWPSKQGNALAQPLVCKMDWNTEFALYLQSPRTIQTPQRGIVFLHFCYSVGWNPQSGELCAGWHLRTHPGLVPHVHTGHRCCFGQLDGPWDHLPPLSGLPVCTITFTDQLLSLIALDKAPKPHSPRAMRGDKEMPQPLSLPMALSFWCPEPGFPSALQHSSQCQDRLQHPQWSPLVTSSGSEFASVLPEASERVMEQVGRACLDQNFTAGVAVISGSSKTANWALCPLDYAFHFTILWRKMNFLGWAPVCKFRGTEHTLPLQF